MNSSSLQLDAEQQLQKLQIKLPPPPAPLGAYVEAVQTGNLLFLSGTLPIVAKEVQYPGRIGIDLTIEEGRKAAYIAAINAFSIAQHHLGSLNKVKRVVRLVVTLATDNNFKEHPKVADAASELFESVFGKDKTSARIVLGAASLPLGCAALLEVILEVES